MSDVNQYLKLPYSLVMKQAEDGTILASVAELPGCFAEGDTMAEAYKNLREAMAVWLQQALDARLTIPVPEKD